ncbi:MAG: uracil-DNA glycosylase [Candidatus Eisenbacteria sp.]|nr:uracil-DNA glycosylase [Candidatus Eisenbacteria bacterium]
MQKDHILQAIALQIEAEIDRGISIWIDPAWNEPASSFLARAASSPRSSGAQSVRGQASATRSKGRQIPAARSKGRQIPAARSEGRQIPAARQAESRPSFSPPPPATGRDRDWKSKLEKLRQETLACKKCPLHETRTNVVFNSGSGKIPLVFVSEAPGANEDAQGEAFVGRAGDLLTKIIAAIGIDRRDVYICNVLKCRPPGNRNPMPDEIAACSPYLARQLEILKPRVICTLGLFATQLLLDTKAPIGKLRGRVFRYLETPLLPTYHPAALLRNPHLKRTVWEDVQLLRKILDGGIKKAGIEIQMTESKPAARPIPQSGDLFESS